MKKTFKLMTSAFALLFVTQAVSAQQIVKDKPIDENIKITFNEPVRNLDNSDLTDSIIDGMIVLRKNSVHGEDVEFVANISNDKTTIEIDPINDLQESAVYFVTMVTVEDFAGNAVVPFNGLVYTEGSEVAENEDNNSSENNVEANNATNSDFSAMTNLVNVYPNPVRNILHIDNVSEMQRITIHSITGQLVENQTSISSVNMNLDLGQYNNGTYIITFYKNDGTRFSTNIVKI